MHARLPSSVFDGEEGGLVVVEDVVGARSKLERDPGVDLSILQYDLTPRVHDKGRVKVVAGELGVALVEAGDDVGLPLFCLLGDGVRL